MVAARTARSIWPMRIQLVACVFLIGCQGVADDGDVVGAVQPGPSTASDAIDPVKEIFDEVDGDRLVQLMRDLSGVDPVDVGGTTITLGERFSADGRKRFRLYWM